MNAITLPHARNRLEPEHVVIEREAALEIPNAQHRVVEFANLHVMA